MGKGEAEGMAGGRFLMLFLFPRNSYAIFHSLKHSYAYGDLEWEMEQSGIHHEEPLIWMGERKRRGAREAGDLNKSFTLKRVELLMHNQPFVSCNMAFTTQIAVVTLKMG